MLSNDNVKSLLRDFKEDKIKKGQVSSSHGASDNTSAPEVGVGRGTGGKKAGNKGENDPLTRLRGKTETLRDAKEAGDSANNVGKESKFQGKYKDSPFRLDQLSRYVYVYVSVCMCLCVCIICVYVSMGMCVCMV